MPSYKAAIEHIKDARKGDYFERVFNITGLSLTGKSAKCQVKAEVDSETLLEFSTAATTIVISGSSLTIKCDADLFTLPTGLYIYDIEIFTNVHDVATIIEGTFEVVDQTTK